MALIPAVKQALKIVGRIDNKYNLNKIFIQKYVPPGYRKRANKIVEVAGALGGGYGIVRFIETLYAPETPGNGASVPFQKQPTSRKPYQTRRRQSTRYNPRCPTKPDFSSRSRRSSTREYYSSSKRQYY